MLDLMGNVISCKLYKKFGFPRVLPQILTFSVNNWCNSKCKTCNIWKYDSKEKMKEQLNLDEIEKIFSNFKKLNWITITGGEPFLRRDLSQIVETICNKSNLKILTIATNGTMPEKIALDVKKILKSCSNLNFTVNISFDGIGSKHDEIRGLRGNFKKVIRTLNLLKKIRNPRLTVGINTVISKYNVDNFFEVYEYVKNVLKPDSFIIEIAERRAKLYNENLAISPKHSDYKKILDFLIPEIQNSGLIKSEIVKNLRKEYYKFLLSRKPIKNFEGIASAYIMPNGEVWLSYSKRFIAGNLREVDYDFRKLWFGKRAMKIRNIMDNDYKTMLANAFYVNFICNPKNIFKVIIG